MNKKNSFLLVLVVPILFLLIGTVTLPKYGVNWDEPFHFMRGQAYLHFLLTGEKDYSSLPPYPMISRDCFDSSKPKCDSPGGPADKENYWGGNLIYENVIKSLYPKNSRPWRSYYQHNTYTFDEIIKIENGHPAIGDISAAFFNFIFYQKLHLLGDIESYHFFEVVASFLIVLGVALIVYYELGTFPAIVASGSLAAYPLFFSESHFNIKDPPEAAFYGLIIIAFYFGVVKRKWKLMVLSAVFFAFALGTKFNALFLIPTLGLWFFVYLLFNFLRTKGKKIRINNFKKFIPLGISLLIYPLIVIGIFYFLWPYLWPKPFENLMVIMNFYRQIGLGTPPELSRFLINGWNTYPTVWIVLTTPIPILFLVFVGFVWSFFQVFFKKSHFYFLILIWFLLPILRVSVPNSSIYGGVRQIMEFVPALAILSGVGAYALTKKLRYRKITILLITASLLFVFYEMVKIHPNQNVYFNQLIGGLAGAKAKEIPYWGNSYGNAYQQGIDWLNKNAQANAKLGLPISTMGNIPRIKLRSDIDFSNSHWSGPARLGEYEIELDFDWAPTAWYSFAYYDTYLNPVYEAKVDGVSLLEVWKNDLAHTKPGFEKEEDYPISKIKKDAGVVLLDMGKNIFLTRVTIDHSTDTCTPHKGGYIAISEDGNSWIREPEPIDYPQVPPSAVGWDEDTFVFLFAAKKARYILIDTLMKDSCYLKNPKIETRGLKELP